MQISANGSVWIDPGRVERIVVNDVQYSVCQLAIIGDDAVYIALDREKLKDLHRAIAKAFEYAEIDIAKC